MKNNYRVTIGLEVHLNLKTGTKLFCGCRNDPSGEPNTHVCPVCTGQPGTLPVMSREALSKALTAASALGASVRPVSVFERKQYFYPDLPRNYQISQYKQPLAEGGTVEVSGRKIRINRVHMEEDAGKLIHEKNGSLVDLNRSGTPLVEIVTEPDIHSPSEAAEYLRTLRQIMRYCGVSDCDMEKGSLRCDANISLSAPGSELGVKTEVKNMNSFRSVEKALEYEVSRQARVLGSGGKVTQETRLWDDDNQVTKQMRSKEEAHDYRYFPDPDLPPLNVVSAEEERARASLPELPQPRKRRFMNEFGLSEYDASGLTQEKERADYFEEALEVSGPENAKKLANWILVELTGKVNSEGTGFTEHKVSPPLLGELVGIIEKGTISGKMGKDIFEKVWDTGRSPLEIVESEGSRQITSEDEITPLCREIINENPGLVKKYLNGKETVVGAMIGEVMRKTGGRANPGLVKETLVRLIREK